MTDTYGATPPAGGGFIDPKVLYEDMMKKRQQPQTPIRSWTQVAAGILDAAADQMQLNRLMRASAGAQQDVSTALGLPSGGADTPATLLCCARLAQAGRNEGTAFEQ